MTHHSKTRFISMKDIFLSIFKTTEERLKNPFIGTFIISFIAYNWKPLSVFFLSSQKIEQRIAFISNNYTDIFNLLIYPLVTSVIYIVLLPYLMWLFESLIFKSYKERNQNLYKNKLIDISGKKSVAESEIELENLKANYKEMADLNKQLQLYKDQIFTKDLDIKTLEDKIHDFAQLTNDLESTIQEKDKKINKLYVQLEDSEITTRNYYDEYENTPQKTILDFVNNLHLINKADKNENNTFFIDRFIALGLLQVNKDDNTRKEYIQITDKGLFYIKRAFSSRII